MLAELTESVLMPPLNCLLLAVVGLVVRRWKKRLGTVLIVSAGVLLWVFATPWFATSLLRGLQTSPHLAPEALGPPPGAVVILSAGMDRQADELSGPAVGPFGLQRLRYGVVLHRATGVPILVSGGVPAVGYPAHAVVMSETLEQQYQVAVRWIEPKSKDTFENAKYSARLLSEAGVRRIWLVTHAWHMPRARRAFEFFGLEVIPAPTGFRAAPDRVLHGLVPRWTALRDTSLALHEYLGMVWYELVHY